MCLYALDIFQSWLASVTLVCMSFVCSMLTLLKLKVHLYVFGQPWTGWMMAEDLQCGHRFCWVWGWEWSFLVQKALWCGSGMIRGRSTLSMTATGHQINFGMISFMCFGTYIVYFFVVLWRHSTKKQHLLLLASPMLGCRELLADLWIQ